MSRYFEFFPVVTHTDVELINITLKGRITDYVKANPFVFMPYVVEDDMRPEDVSYYYYGSVDHTWLIFYANDIVDPYLDWPMSEDNLQKHIMKKYYNEALHYYQSVNNAVTSITDWQVLEWSMKSQYENANGDIVEFTDNIVEYRHIEDDLVNLSTESYLFNANNYLEPIYANTDPIDVCNTMIEVIDSCELVLYEADIANTYLFESTQYEPIRVYDWEIEQNENKRHINVIERGYLSQILSQFRNTMNE